MQPGFEVLTRWFTVSHFYFGVGVERLTMKLTVTLGLLSLNP